MAKFDMREHERRMRELLKPPTPISPLADRIRGAVRKRKLPLPPSRSVTSGV